jgi:hypothetical protein
MTSALSEAFLGEAVLVLEILPPRPRVTLSGVTGTLASGALTLVAAKAASREGETSS